MTLPDERPAARPGASLPVGLCDMPTFPRIVDTLCEVFGWDRATVEERLFREALQPGWNVTSASREAGVTPHVFGPAMEALYGSTDAFVFELAAGHSSALCWEVDARVNRMVARRAPDPARARVIVYGDGIGSDSLRLAQAGYRVTYFEFDGYSSRLARHRFARAGVAARIECVTRPEAVPAAAFDLLVCREVLEHVPDAPAFVAGLNRCLVTGGAAIITESFSELSPWYPTHLACNRRHVGRVSELFACGGFALEESGGGSLCMFRKAGEPGRGVVRNLWDGKWRLRLRRVLAPAAD